MSNRNKIRLRNMARQAAPVWADVRDGAKALRARAESLGITYQNREQAAGAINEQLTAQA